MRGDNDLQQAVSTTARSRRGQKTCFQGGKNVLL
jgi:hypothetical protein